MKILTTRTRLVSLLGLLVVYWSASYAQITPSADSYTNTADPTINYGAKTLLDVDGASQITYIQFNLASIPSTAGLSQATLKLYVNSVTTAGSFNVDYVNGTWSESTIDSSNAPPLGTTIASNVDVTTADKNQYILINVTSAVQAWLNGSETNDGIALVANSTFNATFDSKENTTTSHAPELDIAFAGGEGTITGVTTASGSGLSGGGTSGTLDLSLTNACATNQILQWNGSTWKCSSAGKGTITSVTAGTGLTGGGTGGAVTLNLDTTKVPQLAAANTFTASQTITTTNSPVVFGNNVATSGNVSGIIGATESPTGAGVIGEATSSASGSLPAAGVLGSTFTPTGYGVEGIHYATSGQPIGVYGQATNCLGCGYGVYGTGSIGTYGVSGTPSATGNASGSTGVWGDSANQVGVAGTSDSYYAGYFQNNSGDYPTLFAFKNSPGSAGFFESDSDGGLFGATLIANNFAPAPDGEAFVFVAEDNETSSSCAIDIYANLTCTGTKSAVVPVDGGSRKVALYAVEAPENWFEDFGSGQLSNGSARVDLEPTFAQTVNTDLDYHVFLTPKGDCKGLYVSHESATSFEVHELGGGTSSVAFDYRIIAKRKKYETIRLADLTERYKNLEMQHERMRQRKQGTAPAASNAASTLGQKTGTRSTIENHLRPTPSAVVVHSSTN